jgi:hypothetical protein
MDCRLHHWGDNILPNHSDRISMNNRGQAKTRPDKHRVLQASKGECPHEMGLKALQQFQQDTKIA